MKLSRRQLLAGCAGLAGLGLAGALGARYRSVRSEAPEPGPAPFTSDEIRVLGSAADRVFPGSADAGVVPFVSYWVTHDRYFERFGRDLKTGLGVLERIAREKHGRGFVDCQPAEQDSLLAAMAEGRFHERGFNSRSFFERLVTFTLESYFGDPKYGGNRGQVGWHFIGHRPCWWAPHRRPARKGGR